MKAAGVFGGNGTSSDASVDADGQVVAFDSQATSLLDSGYVNPGQTYVYDATGAAPVIQDITVDPNGDPGYSYYNLGQPSISSDGSKVAFVSTALLVPLPSGLYFPGYQQVYLRDRTAATTQLITQDVADDGYLGANGLRLRAGAQRRRRHGGLQTPPAISSPRRRPATSIRSTPPTWRPGSRSGVHLGRRVDGGEQQLLLAAGLGRRRDGDVLVLRHQPHQHARQQLRARPVRRPIGGDHRRLRHPGRGGLGHDGLCLHGDALDAQRGDRDGGLCHPGHRRHLARRRDRRRGRDRLPRHVRDRHLRPGTDDRDDRCLGLGNTTPEPTKVFGVVLSDPSAGRSPPGRPSAPSSTTTLCCRSPTRPRCRATATRP